MILYDDDRAEFPDTLYFWFRPATVRENLSVVYEKMRVMGMSHQYQSYSHTENMNITFEIYANALMILGEISKEAARGSAEGSLNDLRLVSDMIEQDRRFLEALTLPYEIDGGAIGVETPPVILCIPGIVTARARVTNLSFEFVGSDINGNLTEYRAAITFEEAPLSRITMRDQLAAGSFRTWGF
jgi:hypothetical protein